MMRRNADNTLTNVDLVQSTTVSSDVTSCLPDWRGEEVGHVGLRLALQDPADLVVAPFQPPFGSWRAYQSMLDGDEGLSPPYSASKIDWRWAQRDKSDAHRQHMRLWEHNKRRVAAGLKEIAGGN